MNYKTLLVPRMSLHADVHIHIMLVQEEEVYSEFRWSPPANDFLLEMAASLQAYLAHHEVLKHDTVRLGYEGRSVLECSSGCHLVPSVALSSTMRNGRKWSVTNEAKNNVFKMMDKRDQF